MSMLCPVPHCGKKMRRPRMGMCRHCQRVFTTSYVPHAGFIPTTTTRRIARSILKTHAPSRSDIEEALKIARGNRHRSGPWDHRPPYRLTPLLTGSANKRRPQLLVGKRNQPQIEMCVAGLVQEYRSHLDTAFFREVDDNGFAKTGIRAALIKPLDGIRDLVDG